MQIFERAEIDFWVNMLGNDPTELCEKINQLRQAEIPLTVNEARRLFNFYGQPFLDHPDPQVGNKLINGEAPEDPDGPRYRGILKACAKAIISSLKRNAPERLEEPAIQRLMQLLEA